MYEVNKDGIYLVNAWSMNLAEFLFCQGSNDFYRFVIGMPTTAIYEIYKENPSNPLSMLSGPMRWNQEGFLDWLAQLAAWDWGKPGMEPQIRGKGKRNLYYMFRLTRTADTQSLLDLLEFPDDVILPFLKRHATFKPETP